MTSDSPKSSCARPPSSAPGRLPLLLVAALSAAACMGSTAARAERLPVVGTRAPADMTFLRESASAPPSLSRAPPSPSRGWHYLSLELRGGGQSAEPASGGYDDDDDDGAVSQRVRPDASHRGQGRRNGRRDDKKSNAVGDPDGNSSDDEDSSDSEFDLDDLSDTELEEMLEKAEAVASERFRAESERKMALERGMEIANNIVGASASGSGSASAGDEERVEMEVEVDILEAEMMTDSALPTAGVALTSTRGGGGGGPRPRTRSRSGRGSGGGDKGDGAAQSPDAESARAAARQSIRDAEDGDAESADRRAELERRRAAALDDALSDAFLPLLFLPPPPGAAEVMADGMRRIDADGRRRLDRRTLYEGLLVELTQPQPQSSSNRGKDAPVSGAGGIARVQSGRASEQSRPPTQRRYLNPPTARALRSALSLASQPRWRRHVALESRTPGSLSGGDGGDGSADEDEEAPSGEGGPWYASALRLYRTDDEVAEESRPAPSGGGGGPPMGSMGPMGGMWGQSPGMPQGNEEGGDGEEGGRSDVSVGPSSSESVTMGMQETVAAALAHSLGCGLALVDDESLGAVRKAVLDAQRSDLASSDDGSPLTDMDLGPELRNAALLGHLVRLAEEGRFSSMPPPNHSGRISDRMERDLKLQLDDPHDDLATESLEAMREDEKTWLGINRKGGGTNAGEEGGDDAQTVKDAEDNSSTGPDQGAEEKATTVVSLSAPDHPLPLVFFIRTDASPSLLRSKSAVERLARECVKDDGIHLLVLGKGIDASTTSLPEDNSVSSGAGSGAPGAAVPRMGSRVPGMPSAGQTPGMPFFGMGMPSPQQGQPQQGDADSQQDDGNNPFAKMMSSFPPGQTPGTFGFSQQNINASGINDPEGSRRINIFLARTLDKDGSPGIVGAIAPPQAGNLFPQMLANHAKENMLRMHQQQQEGGNGAGPSEEERRQLMQRWSEMMQSQQQQQGGENGNSMPSPQFFNASIGTPFGNFGGPGGMPTPPPEVIQQAMQQAMSSVVDRLADLHDKPTEDSEGNRLPPHLAQAFSEILKNENLRKGIAENLARAAPALIDPRCQGVMLSVYVPPGPDHPNRGLMPGQQEQGQGQGRQTSKGKRGGGGTPNKAAGPHRPHSGAGSVGGWLNKILSSSSSSDRGLTEETKSSDSKLAEASISDDEEEGTIDEDGKEEDSSDEMEDLDEDVEDQKGTSSKTTGQSVAGKTRWSKEEEDDGRNGKIGAVAGALGPALNKDLAAKEGSKLTAPDQRAQRHLSRLESLCRPVPLSTPIDPVRSRSWDAWANRERGAVIFRSNRRALQAELEHRMLRIKDDAGTRGAGSVLRQMLSVRDIGDEMEEVVRTAVEIEAARSQRHRESPWEVAHDAGGGSETVTVGGNKPIDKSLEQLLLEDEVADMEGSIVTAKAKRGKSRIRKNMQVNYLHPSSLESALSLMCGISPAPSGTSSSAALSGGTTQASHRTREEIQALAKDKHERALVSQVVSPQDIGVSYDMIGGLSVVKELLRQSITYPLKYPHLYSEGIAREAVKGVLLFGPPGTGKTMLAKAVATEGGATFLSVDASSVENKWLGESEKNAKAVFTLARRLAPCVIFIDEVDSILSSREGSSDDSAHGTLTSVKTTMMSEWDGLNSGTNGGGVAGSDRVIVIGSTNRPFDLDEAVLRRFPRRILVDLPDMETRREIVEVTMAENRLATDVNMTIIAERLEGYTGSDIKEVCREAVVQISHEQARLLDQGYLMEDDLEHETETSKVHSSGSISGLQRLRPVTMRDFESAMGKLKRSVSEKGRELARVWEWNEEYGEIKKTNKGDRLPQLMNMFL